jgi:ABC-type Fe3+-hydroxamate transport system substrate-binding protein
MRIVSLVPSWTEYLLDLGVHVVGRTKFCVRPDITVKHIEHIGGTKSINSSKIAALKPDLIIANLEENDREQVEECQRFCAVLLTDVRSVESAWDEAKRIAVAVGKREMGELFVRRVQEAWGSARPLHSQATYVVWKDPLMLAGSDTYISDVMRWWGIENVGGQWTSGRYPQPPNQEWMEAKADWVLLPSEPFPFSEKHLSDFSANVSTPFLVDGEAFSWYGSRMLHATEYFNSLIHTLQQTHLKN